MILEGMIIILSAVLIILLIILLWERNISKSKNPKDTIEYCPDVAGEAWKNIIADMNNMAQPPPSQPVYTLMRNVPKDIVTSSERLYCKASVDDLSNHRLQLIDIDNLDWLA